MREDNHVALFTKFRRIHIARGAVLQQRIERIDVARRRILHREVEVDGGNDEALRRDSAHRRRLFAKLRQ